MPSLDPNKSKQIFRAFPNRKKEPRAAVAEDATEEKEQRSDTQPARGVEATKLFRTKHPQHGDAGRDVLRARLYWSLQGRVSTRARFETIGATPDCAAPAH